MWRCVLGFVRNVERNQPSDTAANSSRWQVKLVWVTAVQKEVSFVISLNGVCSVRRTCTESVWEQDRRRREWQKDRGVLRDIWGLGSCEREDRIMVDIYWYSGGNYCLYFHECIDSRCFRNVSRWLHENNPGVTVSRHQLSQKHCNFHSSLYLFRMTKPKLMIWVTCLQKLYGMASFGSLT